MKFSILILTGTAILFLASCKARWSEDDKDMLLKRCIEMDAQRYGFSEPEKHCDCIVKKIVAQYPDPNQFENMEMGEYGKMVAECQGMDLSTKEIWSESTQNAFRDSCTSMASRQNKPNAASYCDCALKGLMEKYPTNDSIGKISQQAFLEISRNCE